MKAKGDGGLILAIGAKKPDEYSSKGDDEPEDDEPMSDDEDDGAGTDAVQRFFEAGAKKDYKTAYDALASAVALCKGKG